MRDYSALLAQLDRAYGQLEKQAILLLHLQGLGAAPRIRAPITNYSGRLVGAPHGFQARGHQTQLVRPPAKESPTPSLPKLRSQLAPVDVQIKTKDVFPWPDHDRTQQNPHLNTPQGKSTQQWMRWATGHDTKGVQVREPYHGAIKDATIRKELGRLALNVARRAAPSLRQGAGAALEHLGRSIEQPRFDPIHAARLGAAVGFKELGSAVRNPAIPLVDGAKGALRSAGARALDHLGEGVTAPSVGQAIGGAVQHGASQAALDLAGRIKQSFAVPDEAITALRVAGGTLDDLLRLRLIMGQQPEDETKKAAFGFPDKPDLETHAALVRARSAFHRTKLRHQVGFGKLTPKAQKEILAAYDQYHSAMEQAVLSGKISPESLR